MPVAVAVDQMPARPLEAEVQAEEVQEDKMAVPTLLRER